MIAARRPRIALVAQLVAAPEDGSSTSAARIALEQALVATRRWVGTREALHLVRHDHGVLLLLRRAGPPADPSGGRRRGISNEALRHATRGLASVERTVVGVGQARAAAGRRRRVLRRRRAGRPGRRPTARARAGSSSGRVWASTACCPGWTSQQLDVAGVHPGLARLLRESAPPGAAGDAGGLPRPGGQRPRHRRTSCGCTGPRCTTGCNGSRSSPAPTSRTATSGSACTWR